MNDVIVTGPGFTIARHPSCDEVILIKGDKSINITGEEYAALRDGIIRIEVALGRVRRVA